MKILVITSGMENSRVRLQPMHYIYEFCVNAQQMGVQIQVVSDGHPKMPEHDLVQGVPVLRLRGIRSLPCFGNQDLQATIARETPDAIVWHTGITSALHLNLRPWRSRPIFALFTSAVYSVGELSALGPSGLRFMLRARSAAVAGALIPSHLIRRFFNGNSMEAVVTLSEASRKALVQRGVPANRIFLVRPGVDSLWLNTDLDKAACQAVRQELGFTADDFVVVYFGPPLLYRGSDTLIRSIALQAQSLPSLRLLLLIRRQTGKREGQEKQIETLIETLGINSRTKILPGFLTREELVRFIAAADAVALPLNFVSSEAPLSIFEAMALGKPVISTHVDGIPELLADGRGILVQPRASRELAEALAYLARNPGAAAEMGSKARDFIRARGGWPQATQDILKVIDAHIN
jgi:glycosyltransferase involved in cell wall biosynthesis